MLNRKIVAIRTAGEIVAMYETGIRFKSASIDYVSGKDDSDKDLVTRAINLLAPYVAVAKEYHVNFQIIFGVEKLKTDCCKWMDLDGYISRLGNGQNKDYFYRLLLNETRRIFNKKSNWSSVQQIADYLLAGHTVTNKDVANITNFNQISENLTMRGLHPPTTSLNTRNVPRSSSINLPLF